MGMRSFWFLCASLPLCAASAAVGAQAPRVDGVSVAAKRFAVRSLEAIPGLPNNPTGVLVRFPDDVGEGYKAAVRAMVGDGSTREEDASQALELVTIRVPPHVARERLAPFVELVEADRVVRALVDPSDPNYGQLWGLHNSGQTVAGDPGVAGHDINAPEAWSVTQGAADFAIAVIDTGIDHAHPDLAANIWANSDEIPGNGVDDDANGHVDDVRGWDFYSQDADPFDEQGHGTHVAGTIGAVGNNGIGVAGVVWRCKLVPLRFLGPNGGYISGAIGAIDYCRRNGIKLSNNSWGGGGYTQALSDAIRNAGTAGHLFVAAAGNSNLNTDSTAAYPVSYPLDTILGVAACNNDGARAYFSNYGARHVDIAAPGTTIQSTWPGGGYNHLQGTSMAAPHVTGAAALVWAANPAWSALQVRQRLLATARPLPGWTGVVATGGLLDAGAAVGGSPAPNTPPTVRILAPRTNTAIGHGASATLQGTGSDREDGVLSAAIEWNSSLQGVLGTGALLVVSGLQTGTHVLTARATDAGGLSATHTINLIVRPPPPPRAPTAFVARRPDASWRVDLSWRDNANNESWYEIERQVRPIGGLWSPAGAVVSPADATTATEQAFPGWWRWRVRAVGATGASPWSPWRIVRI
jgi:subtilisin family serine protease